MSPANLPKDLRDEYNELITVTEQCARLVETLRDLLGAASNAVGQVTDGRDPAMIDLALICHATLSFDMAQIPLWAKTAYMRNGEMRGTVVSMDIYTDQACTKLLAEGVLMSAFTAATVIEIEDMLASHLRHKIGHRVSESITLLAQAVRQ